MADNIDTDTLIIGGGISGFAAGRHLFNNNMRFILVTDRIGGRMYHSESGDMNFGATYVNDDYHNVLKFVGKGRKLRLKEVYTTNENRPVSFYRILSISHAFPFLRLILLLRRLRKELINFRRKAEYVPQATLLPQFPLMQKLSETSAESLIKDLKIEVLNRDYFRYAAWATCFAEVGETSALFYLGMLFPIIVNTYVADFSKTYKKLLEGFDDRVVIDKVKKLDTLDNHRKIAYTSSGKSITAKNFIIAAPYHNACEFYPNTPKPFSNKPATVIHARGYKHKIFLNKNFILLNPEKNGIVLVWRQNNGNDLILSLRRDPNLSCLYEHYEIMCKVSWKTAVVLSDQYWCKMQLEDNIYLAGDYNICGLEDSFISGVCAANQIIRSELK